MSKVTSKLQVTLPKAIAHEHGIRPGDEIAFESANDVIRIVPAPQAVPAYDLDQRLKLFDNATARQRRRNSASQPSGAKGRGWRREELYDRPLSG